MMMETIRFEDFDISDGSGFAFELPDSLPDYFRPWHELAEKSVNLMASNTMRETTHKMPILDSTRLQRASDLKLAYLQLTVIAKGYVWENHPTAIAQSLPACVAIPYCDVSDRLGMPAGPCYHAIISNWERVDKNGPYTRDNFRIRYILRGGQQFINFVALTVELECQFTRALPAIKDVLEGSKARDAEKVTTALVELSQWVDDFTVAVMDYHKIMEPDVFYRIICTNFRGFNGTSGYPQGMLYEGVVDRPRRTIMDYAASQSVIFQTLDCLLQIEYPPDKVEIFSVWRSTWPLKYRQFYEALRSWSGNIKELVESSANEKLTSAYDGLVNSVKHFRTVHIQLVTKFSVMQFKKMKEETNYSGPDNTAYMLPLLKGIRDAMAKSVMRI